VLFYADGQTDMTKLIVAFRNFANAPKNGVIVCGVLVLYKIWLFLITYDLHATGGRHMVVLLIGLMITCLLLIKQCT
jgi:hypothetical protein